MIVFCRPLLSFFVAIIRTVFLLGSMASEASDKPVDLLQVNWTRKIEDITLSAISSMATIVPIGDRCTLCFVQGHQLNCLGVACQQ